MARANKVHYSRCASAAYNLSLKWSLSVIVALIHVSAEWDRFTWLPRVSEDETLPQNEQLKKRLPKLDLISHCSVKLCDLFER